MGKKMDLASWRSMPIGGVITEPGNSVHYETGSWRSLRPVVDMVKCTHCMICWIFCPDSAVLVEDGRFLGFALNSCKGCGICAVECPPKCIEMVGEESFLGEDP